LTRGFLMSRRRCGVRPRFFSTARLTLRAPSTVASGSGGAGAGAAYLPPQPGAQAQEHPKLRQLGAPRMMDAAWWHHS